MEFIKIFLNVFIFCLILLSAIILAVLIATSIGLLVYAHFRLIGLVGYTILIGLIVISIIVTINMTN